MSQEEFSWSVLWHVHQRLLYTKTPKIPAVPEQILEFTTWSLHISLAWCLLAGTGIMQGWLLSGKFATSISACMVPASVIVVVGWGFPLQASWLTLGREACKTEGFPVFTLGFASLCEDSFCDLNILVSAMIFPSVPGETN